MGLDDGLVGYWPMNELSGEPADFSGQGNNGTATGTTIVDGKIGKARSFVAASLDYVTVPDSPSLYLGSAFSFAFWFKATSAATTQPLITKDGNSSGTREWGIWLVSGKLYLEAGTDGNSLPNTYTANTVLSNNILYHAVFTYDGVNIAIYLNGLSDFTPAAFTGPLFDTTQVIYFGRRTAAYFGGVLDDLSIYNRALSATEINQRFLFGNVHYFGSTIRPRAFAPGIAR